MIEISFKRSFGDFAVDVAFTAESGIVALFGPSGSGKSTILNAVAGLVTPDEGRIAIGGQVLFDSGRRINLPRHRRRIGYVFQESRLFPHLSVARNLRYGRFFTPVPERYVDVDEIVALLGIGHLLRRSPATLSGGERQRVAIGRALLASPRLLLMDEPLSSLDEERRAETLPYLERLRDVIRVPILYVSHSRAEVERLADRIVHIRNGRLDQNRSPGEASA